MENNLLGKYLRQLRKAQGYTQEYVASQLNIIHQTYSHYETGRIIPPSDSLFNLARLYSIPMDDLMELTVNYQLNPDFIAPYPKCSIASKELSDFLEYVDMPCNTKKFKYLNQKEKRLLYYFQHLSPETQSEVADILELRYQYKLREQNTQKK